MNSTYCARYQDEFFNYDEADSGVGPAGILPMIPTNKTADIVIGSLLALIGASCLGLNTYLLVIFSRRHNVGVTRLLIQIASIDLVSGLLALIMAKNVMLTNNTEQYEHSQTINIILCQIPGLLFQVVSVALPVLLMYLTIWRLVAVWKPHMYSMYLIKHQRIHYIVYTIAWTFGLVLGFMPFIAGREMCYMPEWAFCDYRLAVVFENDVVKHTLIGILIVLPAIPSYFIIVAGSLAVSVKLVKFRNMKQNQEEISINMHATPRTTLSPNDARGSISTTDSRRFSLRIFEMPNLPDKERSVIISTLIMALSYFVTNFPWVAYILIYVGVGDKNTFKLLSGNNKNVEIYLYTWWYASHALSGVVNAIAQLLCCRELSEPLIKLLSGCYRT